MQQRARGVAELQGAAEQGAAAQGAAEQGAAEQGADFSATKGMAAEREGRDRIQLCHVVVYPNVTKGSRRFSSKQADSYWFSRQN